MVAACSFGAVMSAQAQESFVVEDPSIDPTITICENGGTYDVFCLGEAGMAKLTANPALKVNDYRSADGNSADSHYPGGNADWASDDDYQAVTPTADGRGFDGFTVKGNWYQWWSAFTIARKADTNLTHINKDSHLHIALYMTGDVEIPYINVQWFKADGNDGNAPSFAFTDDIINNKMPVVASLKKDEWVAVDITLGQVAELMKDEFDIDMDYTRLTDDWQGEAVMLSLPSGQDHANGGTPIAENGHGAKAFVDGVYIYTPNDNSGVTDVTDVIKDVRVVISDKTITALGTDNAPMELYSASGAKVKSSATSVIGLEGLSAGVYVVRTLGTAKKVIIK